VHKFTFFKNPYQAAAVIFSLLREDLLYTDKKAGRWTVNKQEGFNNYSEIFKKLFPGCGCRKNGTAYPIEERRVNLPTLFEVLKSKDASLLETYSWMFDGSHKFLDGVRMPG